MQLNLLIGKRVRVLSGKAQGRVGTVVLCDMENERPYRISMKIKNHPGRVYLLESDFEEISQEEYERAAK